MCILCNHGELQMHERSRRNFLKGAAATGIAAASLDLFEPRPAAADDRDAPFDSGRPDRRYVIRGGAVMTMDPSMPNKGEFPQADVLVEGKKILVVGPNLKADGAGVIDAPPGSPSGYQPGISVPD
jgi:hypothetical protein